MPTTNDHLVTLDSGWVVSSSGVKLFRIDTYGIWLYDRKSKVEVYFTFAQLVRLSVAFQERTIIQ